MSGGGRRRVGKSEEGENRRREAGMREEVVKGEGGTIHLASTRTQQQQTLRWYLRVCSMYTFAAGRMHASTPR